MSNVIKFTWVRDEYRDADADAWTEADTWTAYVEDPSEEEDYSMQYASITLLENGKFHSEVGTCGMYGGQVEGAVLDTLDDAMEAAGTMFIKHFADSIVSVISSVKKMSEL